MAFYKPEQLLAARCKKLARDLLEIAEQAMPSTFFFSDSRTQYARETLELFKRRQGRTMKRS